MSAAPKLTPALAIRVQHWDDERDMGNSLIVSLNHGWRFPELGEVRHVEGFDTVRDARAGVRAAIKCDCKECSAALAKVTS